MNGKRLFILGLALVGLFIIVGVTISLGAEQNSAPQAPSSPLDAVASSIYYQGKLEEDGIPVHDQQRDMVFRFYDNDVCTNQVGLDIPKSNVTITNGFFSEELTVPQNIFNGQGLWLQVEIEGTTLGCEKVLPTPYALSLKPGAYVAGAVHSTLPDGVIHANNTSTSGIMASGLLGESASTYGVGLYGQAKATSGANFGVIGESQSTSGSGLAGYALATTGQAYGVQGISNSPYGAGVYAEGAGSGPALILGGQGKVYSDPTDSDSDLRFFSNDNIHFMLDKDGDNTDSNFNIWDDSNPPNLLFRVNQEGTATVKVLQITGGSDLAEPFEVNGNEPVVPGMVVCIDPENPGELMVCHQAYDHKVAGVISGAGGVEPGLIMGQEGSIADGAYPVALNGRVYVLADASTTPIHPGDLLTTSSVPGHAMVAENGDHIFGATIGKAMTGLDSGVGLVLVLVTLQ